jgi:hypothetical protein
VPSGQYRGVGVVVEAVVSVLKCWEMCLQRYVAGEVALG